MKGKNNGNRESYLVALARSLRSSSLAMVRVFVSCEDTPSAQLFLQLLLLHLRSDYPAATDSPSLEL